MIYTTRLIMFKKFIWIFFFLQIYACSFGEKFNVGEDENKTIKVLIIYTPEAARNLIDRSNPENVDLNDPGNRDLIEADALHKIKIANYSIANSSISHRLELVDGDILDEYSSYILEISEAEMMIEAESSQFKKYCPEKNYTDVPWRFTQHEDLSEIIMSCRFHEWLETSMRNNGIISNLRETSKADVISLQRVTSFNDRTLISKISYGTCQASIPGDDSSGDRDCTGSKVCILDDGWGKEPAANSVDGKCYENPINNPIGEAYSITTYEDQEIVAQHPYIVQKYNSNDLVFEHELGHLIGLRHDYLTDGAELGEFNRGHIDFKIPPVDRCGVGSIMSYTSSCMFTETSDFTLITPYFSNHQVIFPYLSSINPLEKNDIQLGIDTDSHYGACMFEQMGESISRWYEMTMGGEHFDRNSYAKKCQVPENQLANYSLTCSNSLYLATSTQDNRYYGCTKIIKPVSFNTFTNSLFSRDADHETFQFGFLREAESMYFSFMESDYNFSTQIKFNTLKTINGDLSFAAPGNPYPLVSDGIEKIIFTNLKEIKGNLIFNGLWIGENLTLDFPSLEKIEGNLEIDLRNINGSVKKMNFPKLKEINGNLILKGENLTGHGMSIYNLLNLQNSKISQSFNNFSPNRFSFSPADPAIYPRNVRYYFPKLKKVGNKISVKQTKLKSLNFINQINSVQEIDLFLNTEMTNCSFPNLDLTHVTLTSDLGFNCNGL